jgi:glucose/mannose-6-phosphate isomerase
MEVTREIAGRHAGTTEVWSEGDGLLARTLSLVQLGDWTSYYLALLRGVDPWPVDIIERMKARLAARG